MTYETSCVAPICGVPAGTPGNESSELKGVGSVRVELKLAGLSRLPGGGGAAALELQQGVAWRPGTCLATSH